MESSKRLQGAVVSSRPLQTSYQVKLKYVSGNATSKCKDHCNVIYICKLNLWLTGKADFAERTRNVEFNQGNSVAKFTIPIIKDRIFEGTEVCTIQLAKHKSAKTLNIDICNPSTAIGHIIDKGEKINVLSMHILYIGSVINGCFWTKHS